MKPQQNSITLLIKQMLKHDPLQWNELLNKLLEITKYNKTSVSLNIGIARDWNTQQVQLDATITVTTTLEEENNIENNNLDKALFGISPLKQQEEAIATIETFLHLTKKQYKLLFCFTVEIAPLQYAIHFAFAAPMNARVSKNIPESYQLKTLTIA